jgi:short-subunit dehydrogenase
LTVAADLRAVERRLIEDSGITMLVNNAGLGATASLLDTRIEDVDGMISLNVLALTRLTHAAAPGFVARGNGTIINIASIVAITPERLNGTYGASKAYVLAFTQSLQNELGPKGVRVQAVLPGATSTAFWNRAGLPVEHLPTEIVMTAEDMVDAAIAGLDQGEEWQRYDASRLAMGPKLSRSKPATRYNVG